MVDNFIEKESRKEDGLTKTQCFKIFGVSDSGYYEWKQRQLDKSGKQAKKLQEKNDIKEKMRQIIIKRGGIVPGKRTFRTELFRHFGLIISYKRISSLMKEMHIRANRKKKDAYKHQVSHDHVCAAPENLVDQDFMIGPRRVILTDITYLYYGMDRRTFYLCVFRDAFTKENLGFHADSRMDITLVQKAYDMMMELHGSELKKQASVYIHSDQGSVYLSTTFKELLTDDGFLQSVSARGNSQDNAPMESFFGRLKTDVLDLVAMCMTVKDAVALTFGYLKAYNEEHYQYSLAGLTPEEFYLYVTTGIYPLDNYFGVPAAKMMGIGELNRIRRIYADEESRKRREIAAKKRKDRRLIDPQNIIIRDESLLKKKIREWEHQEKNAVSKINHLKTILQKIDVAKRFINSLTTDKLKELTEPLAWRNYEQLSYVFSMNDLF